MRARVYTGSLPTQTDDHGERVDDGKEEEEEERADHRDAEAQTASKQRIAPKWPIAASFKA